MYCWIKFCKTQWWLCTHSMCIVASFYCSGPKVFYLGNSSTPNTVYWTLLFATEQTKSNRSQCSWFQFLWWSGGDLSIKEGPVDSASVQRTYCAHSMILWISVKAFCGGTVENRPQWHIQKNCSCRVYKLLSSLPQWRTVKWNNFTSFPPHWQN